MTFSYDGEKQIVVDSEGRFTLKLNGGRADQNKAKFLFTAPDCTFEVDVYYFKPGIKFEWPGGKNEYGRARWILEYDDDAFIELSMGGFRMISGECDHLTYNRELMEALAYHYRYDGRYQGPIYFRHSGPDGGPTRSQVGV